MNLLPSNLNKSAFSKMLHKMLANCADPDQTAPWEQSDLGLHCLLKQKTLIHVFRVDKACKCSMDYLSLGSVL